MSTEDLGMERSQPWGELGQVAPQVQRSWGRNKHGMFEEQTDHVAQTR